MKKRLLFALGLITSMVMAQAPETFNYQAVIKDASNNVLVSQPVGIQVRILQGSVSGTASYTETFATTTGTEGMISLAIGTGTSTDDFTIIDWANNTFFIEIAADITGGTTYSVIGTSQLKSVPYALHAKEADNVFSGDYNDLTNIPTTSVLQDADGDTKIQVEESANENIIRFDIEGTEYFRMEKGRIHSSGTSVIIGNRAGNSDDLSNNENIYIGYYAGDQNINSAANVAIGRASQEKHTSGNFNTSMGNYSIQKHETGSNNVTIGAYSMNNSLDGDGNTAMGIGALRFNTTGNNNVSIGSFSMYNGTTTAGNVALGNNAGYNATGNNNVFLGKSAGYNATENNALYIDNTNTAFPLVYGEFNNNLLRVNGELQTTGSLGVGETNPQTSLDVVDSAVIGNLSVGAESTDQGTSTSTGLGFTTTPWLYTNAIESQSERGSASTLITVGADGTYGAADQIHFVTSGNSQMMVASNGRVGIDQASPASDLHIRQSQQSIAGGTGGITFEDSSDAADTWRIYHSGIYFSFNKGADRVAYINNTTGAYVQDSDLTLKKNISNMNSTLDKVKQLRPVSYHYKTQQNSEEKVLGFIAQEAQPFFPEMVVTGEDGKLGMAYATSGVIAIKAIQEQQVIIEEQNKKIEKLESELAEIKKMLLAKK
jgi:hypothetical protein